MSQIESSTKTQIMSCLLKSIVIGSKNHSITAEGNRKCRRKKSNQKKSEPPPFLLNFPPP